MAKTIEQTIQERIQAQVGALTVETIVLTATLEAAREEIAALKAKQADNAGTPSVPEGT